MNKKDPYGWFKCDPTEIYRWDRQAWTSEQIGWFHHLRCYSYGQLPRGRLPVDDEALAAVVRRRPDYDKAQWQDVIKKGFIKRGKWLWCPEVERDVRDKQKRSSSARKAANAKHEKERLAGRAEETLLWRGISWPEWALKKLRLEVGCESDALKVEIDSLPDLRQTNPKKAAKIEAEKALYLADLKIMDLCAKTIDDVLAHPAEHRGQGKVKVTWGGKEWYPSELVEKITQNRLLSAAQSVGRKDTNIVRVYYQVVTRAHIQVLKNPNPICTCFHRAPQPKRLLIGQ
jgi:hypothetical protein